jgi:hypothetical protein
LLHLGLTIEENELAVLLRDILRHMSPNRVYEKFQAELKLIALSVSRKYDSFERLLGVVAYSNAAALILRRTNFSVCRISFFHPLGRRFAKSC